jgi:eukaryotic-like serine/threonine-protein kinase
MREDDTARSALSGTAPPRPDAVRLTTLDGRYRVLERIAAGGMGEVYRGYDAVLAREVAIKVLHRSLAGDIGFVERFRREARAAALLNHPNIAGVYDWGAVDGIYYMVMEYVRGRSLRGLLNEHGRLAPAQAADALAQILAALEHAHRKGIVHRDVKPENVIVTPEGVAKVADFGLARAYADGTVTRAGSVTGTVQYLAPEQIRGEPADPRTDLYSVGIVAFELLTGELPFTGETSMAIAYQHVSRRVPAPSTIVPELPPGIDGFVRSAAERDRELRPESATEMRRDLLEESARLPIAKPLANLVGEDPVLPFEDLAEGADTVTVPRAEPPAARRKRRRRSLGGTLGLIMLSAVAVWAVWTYVVPHSIPVRDVVGMSRARAQALLVDDGLRVAIGEGVYTLKVDLGEVVRTRPAPGTSVASGDRVTLIPSLGPPPVSVPDVTGMTAGRARMVLVDAGLRLGARSRRFSMRPEGEIVAQHPAAGRRIPQTSGVRVEISKGPPPISVPDVVGQEAGAAADALRSAGLSATVSERYSDEVARGRVIDQTPDADAEIPKGSAVTLIVSRGPEEFRLPALIGMSKADALATLSRLSLDARVIVLPSSQGGTVLGQDPPPGTVVHAGQEIVVYVA